MSIMSIMNNMTSVRRYRDTTWRREAMTKFLAKRDVAAMQQAVTHKKRGPELNPMDMPQMMMDVLNAATHVRPVLALKLATEGRAMRDINRGSMATCACQVVKYL